jgi:hypothetical protein
VLIVAPCLVVFAASFARRWPLVPRLMLVLVPTLTLLVAAGALAVAGLVPGRVRGLVLAAVGAFLVIPAARFDAITMKNPRRRDDVAPLIRQFHATRAAGDSTVMYVLGHAVVPWVYYTAGWTKKEGASFQYATTRANTAEHFATRACLEQEPRLRVVFSGMGGSWNKDSTLAAEASWLTSQPERDVWVLAISYEEPLLPKFDAQMGRYGAVRTLEERRNGASILRYRLPPASATSITGCDS